MSDTRRRILAFIVDYKALHNGVSPSIAEIGQYIGIASKSNVSYHLQIMEQDGLITRRPRVPRSIEITEAGRQSVLGVGS